MKLQTNWIFSSFIFPHFVKEKKKRIYRLNSNFFIYLHRKQTEEKINDEVIQKSADRWFRFIVIAELSGRFWYICTSSMFDSHPITWFERSKNYSYSVKVEQEQIFLHSICSPVHLDSALRAKLRGVERIPTMALLTNETFSLSKWVLSIPLQAAMLLSA